MVRVRVLVLVGLVSVVVRQSLIVLDAMLVAGRMRVRMTVHESAVNMRVLVDQVHAQ